SARNQRRVLRCQGPSLTPSRYATGLLIPGGRRWLWSSVAPLGYRSGGGSWLGVLDTSGCHENMLGKINPLHVIARSLDVHRPRCKQFRCRIALFANRCIAPVADV